jgi:hypothetical protein
MSALHWTQSNEGPEVKGEEGGSREEQSSELETFFHKDVKPPTIVIERSRR